MPDFPRTKIEDVSVSRLVMGTNWWRGFSHTSRAKDCFIKETMTRERIADVIEVFCRNGVDTLLGVAKEANLLDAIRDAEDRTGRKVITIVTPTLDISDSADALDNTARCLDECAEIGATVCMPHEQTTDALLDRRARTLRDMDRSVAMIRERGMIPGLSTHLPQAPAYADESGLDVATYIHIYNAAGFLMPIEVDWIHRMIWQRKKPVICIKPMAAGRLLPLVGLAFVWATIRRQDMVAVGTLTPREAQELIEISRAQLESRGPAVELQWTRSKASVENR